MTFPPASGSGRPASMPTFSVSSPRRIVGVLVQFVLIARSPLIVIDEQGVVVPWLFGRACFARQILEPTIPRAKKHERIGSSCFHAYVLRFVTTADSGRPRPVRPHRTIPTHRDRRARRRYSMALRASVLRAANPGADDTASEKTRAARPEAGPRADER